MTSETTKHLNRTYAVVLASGSPRRAEILRDVGWKFETFPVDIDESLRPGEDPETYVERLALTKANTAALRLNSRPIVGADTVVVIDGQILGKPFDDKDARQMLKRLQGRWHEVLTGVAVIGRDGSSARVAHEPTEVKFAAMTDSEIDLYVATGEPNDKAGAYAIQGIAAQFIEGIKGDYTNVVGLPVRLLYELLKLN